MVNLNQVRVDQPYLQKNVCRLIRILDKFALVMRHSLYSLVHDYSFNVPDEEKNRYLSVVFFLQHAKKSVEFFTTETGSICCKKWAKSAKKCQIRKKSDFLFLSTWL